MEDYNAPMTTAEIVFSAMYYATIIVAIWHYIFRPKLAPHMAALRRRLKRPR